MPAYTYRCTDPACSIAFEVTHSIHEDGPEACRCGSLVRRVPCAPAVTFKGTGFYRTDSRRP